MNFSQIRIFVLIIPFLFACSGKSGNSNASGEEATAVPVIAVPFDAVAEKMGDEDAGLRVFNFWATWCKPCVAELPYFEKAREKYASKGVDFTLVSLDFPDEMDAKVKPFVEKKGLKSRVWVLDESDPNTWMDKVEPSWNGEIPVTVIVDQKRGVREFISGELEYQELDSLIASALKK